MGEVRGGHIVRAFDEQLEGLRSRIRHMGEMAEGELALAIDALKQGDGRLAEQVGRADAELDALMDEVERAAVQILAQRQPVAVDLREILAALRISPEAERIGDYAKNIAKRVAAIGGPAEPPSSLFRMAREVQTIVKNAFDAYAGRDVDKALETWRRDKEVDDMYAALFREMLTYMMEDPGAITPCTHLLFAARNLERIGDHATNVCESVHYLATGEWMAEERPKGGA